MNGADVIASFATQGPNSDGSYTVTRTAAGTVTSGVYTPGSTSTLTIVASVQPTNGRDLRALAEAQITAESRVIMTATQLIGRSPSNEPDTVAVEADGVPWMVFRVAPWTDLDGGTWYRAIVARQSMR